MTSASDLRQKHCVPCEGGVPPLSPEEVKKLLATLTGWQLGEDGKRIFKKWRAQDFTAALDFLNAVGKIAEEENHHPDLHLTGYRNVKVEISTHAIGGLSENDFILAAKIDEAPIRGKAA